MPAFVGYTERADVDGREAVFVPVRVRSLDEYHLIFGGPPRAQFGLGPGSPDDFDVRLTLEKASLGDDGYRKLVPAGNVGLLYNSLRLFYANGGDTCFVVSVGPYAESVDASVLEKGVLALEDQVGPTMIVVPDLSLLPAAKDPSSIEGFKQVAAAMLGQCGRKQDRVALLDVVQARHLRKTSTGQDVADAVQRFREDVDGDARSYGIAYFPYLETSIVRAEDLDDSWFVAAMLKDVAASDRKQLYAGAARTLNRLPPSGAMAGVIAQTDRTRGVWTAPANISINAVSGLTVHIDDDRQADLNKPLDGKAINVIREFTDRGAVVWGARTLDGNSHDFRYVNVRRTVIYIEQSVKAALAPFAGAANDVTTWVSVRAAISTFLHGLWTQGGLMGTTMRDACDVQCGLGTTMTARDVQDGNLIVLVLAAIVRPAEFIELRFTQKMG